MSVKCVSASDRNDDCGLSLPLAGKPRSSLITVLFIGGALARCMLDLQVTLNQPSGGGLRPLANIGKAVHGRDGSTYDEKTEVVDSAF